MASAAAVGANSGLSPLGNSIGEDEGVAGEITSAVGTKEDLEVKVGDVEPVERQDEEEEDDDVQSTRRRPVKAMNGGLDEPDDVGEDLFGDEATPPPPKRRQLDDEELDSGDDVDRTDRVGEEEAELEAEAPQEYETQEKMTMDVELPRQPLPQPSDGEMYLLKVPGFMEIEPRAWQHNTFQPPTTDHHSKREPSATFSAFNTAMTTIRWRHSPSKPAELQSNARILRWSDGSLTLQLASEAGTMYEMDGNALAPPQRNPIKPTPTSIQAGKKAGRQGAGLVSGEKYDFSKDAFTYMIVPDESSQTLRVTNKITAGLSIRQSDSGADDAVERLQAALATAANATKVNGAGELKLIDEDPEMARKAAEDLMRQKAKADRRREAAILRETERSNRALGRHGLSSGRFGGGLNVGMLEDEDGAAGGGRARPKAARKPRRRAYGSEYSSDEDGGRQRFGNKEDEYDEEDDFVARSDEEEEVVDDDEDEDDGIVEEPSSRRERSPKRDRPPPAAADDEADAEGEPDEEVQQPRTKRRRVVGDDEDEE